MINTKDITITILNFIIIVVIIIILDLIAFSTFFKNSINVFSSIQKKPLNINYMGAITSYILVAIGLLLFSQPNISTEPANVFEIFKESFIHGSLFGIISYGIYDSTMIATFEDYPIKNAITDCIWGGFICSFSLFILNLIKYMIKYSKSI
jgi:uncharacterized membrane protein